MVERNIALDSSLHLGPVRLFQEGNTYNQETTTKPLIVEKYDAVIALEVGLLIGMIFLQIYPIFVARYSELLVRNGLEKLSGIVLQPIAWSNGFSRHLASGFCIFQNKSHVG